MRHTMINYNLFGQENIQLHYIDADDFVLSMKTQIIIKLLQNLEDCLILVT